MKRNQRTTTVKLNSIHSIEKRSSLNERDDIHTHMWAYESDGTNEKLNIKKMRVSQHGKNIACL